jgi:protein-tyrosine phosphatase
VETARESTRERAAWRVTDLHTHILPGVDDGPRAVEESVAIVRLLAELGFDHIFLTPHFRPGFYDSSARTVGDALGRLRASLDGALAQVSFTTANEVHIDSVFDARGTMQDFITFGANPRHVLLEMPRQTFPLELLLHTIDRLTRDGVRVVLAHPERHPELFEDADTRSRICARGALLQVNLTSLAGLAGRRVRKVAEELCRRDMVHAFGTDAHDLARTSKFVPRGLRAASRILGEDRMRRLMEAPAMRETAWPAAVARPPRRTGREREDRWS